MGDLRESCHQLVPQGGHLGGVLVDVGAGLLQRGGHGHDAGDVLGAGPLAPLLSAALDDVGEGDTLTGVQHAHALGAVELVGGERQHVNILGLHVNVQVARRLHRIGVEQHALLPAHRADLRDGQDGADLVVGVHDGDKAGVLPDGVSHLLSGDGAGGAHVQQLHVEALFFQLLQGVQDSVMLEGGGDDVLLALPLADTGGGDKSLIVGLAAAGGKGDLPGCSGGRSSAPPPPAGQRCAGWRGFRNRFPYRAASRRWPCGSFWWWPRYLHRSAWRSSSYILSLLRAFAHLFCRLIG